MGHDTRHSLHTPGIEVQYVMNDSDRRRLDSDGYLILEDFMGTELLGALRQRIDQLFSEEGECAGSEFKQEPQTRRLANLVDKGEVFERVIAMPQVLECIAYVLGPEFKLSSLNARSANPDSDWVQPLHCDAGALPDEKGYWICNSVWMLDDFTPENGPIRMVPGSHRWARLPQDALADPTADHPEQTLLLGKAGTVVIMNTHMWHGAMSNRSARPRRAMHSFYCRADKPQQQYQARLVRLEVQRRLSPQLRKLLALDDPLNDEISSTMGGRSGFMK